MTPLHTAPRARSTRYSTRSTSNSPRSHSRAGSTAARSKDSLERRDGGRLVGEGAERALADDDVEGPCGEIQFLRVLDLEVHAVCETGIDCAAPSPGDQTRRQVDAPHRGPPLYRQKLRRGAEAARHVEHSVARTDTCQVGEPPREVVASRVEPATEEELHERAFERGDATGLEIGGGRPVFHHRVLPTWRGLGTASGASTPVNAARTCSP